MRLQVVSVVLLDKNRRKGDSFKTRHDRQRLADLVSQQEKFKLRGNTFSFFPINLNERSHAYP
jgi:hypothetical protein